MEGQDHMKKEYDELLAQYSRKRSENENQEKCQKEINQAIDNLERELNKITIVPVQNKPIINEEQTIKISEITQQIQELTEQLKKEEEHNQQPIPIIAEINMQTQVNSALKLNLEDLAIGTQVKQLGDSTAILIELQNKNKQQQFEITLLHQDLSKEERELTQLQRQISQLESNMSIHSAVVGSSQEFQVLQDEIAQLEKEFRQLEEGTRIVREKQLSKQQAEQAIKREQENELNCLKHHNSQLTNCKKKYEEELANLDANTNNKSLQLQREKKLLEEDEQKKVKDIQSLKRQIGEKRAEEQKRRNQEKNKKKDKPRNFKQQNSEAHTLHDVFNKELQREKDKLTELSQLKKTYTSNESLQILQKQLERHQITNRPSLATEETKKDRILKENQSLKSRIDFLKKSTKQMEDDGLRLVKETKAKGDELVNQKLAHQKLSKQVTSKLNDYMKEYPDHEAIKEEKKNEQKRLKHELKEKQKQRLRLQKEKIKTKQEPTQITNQTVEKNEDLNKTAWERWKEWDNSGTVGSQTTILKNRQFQIACGLVVLIAIVLLTYGV